MPTAKRDDILAATRALVCEDGVQAASMSRIARRAGVGMGTIYNYFDSKEALLGAMYVEDGRRLHSAIFAEWPENAPVEQRFKHVWRSMIRHYEADPEAFRFTQRVQGASGLPDAARSERQALWHRIDREFSDAVASGAIEATDLPVFLTMLHGSIDAYIGWRTTRDAASPAAVERVLDGFWRALAPN